ncbi:inositol monophosphatase family protein [Candidatus Fokinia crypta]|uniref:Inositol-1-monophosphatase n=1 Tax=Candidatus Fokinia crypta TaxID=1920990 RepID=A0ABZ0UQ13_9RICK|nr:inositol monophosphatase family protein [Candidatus Fokinia cryptica]WPX97977.1 Inositol-1-monophosphatase [Candidatus Fokinia cryptica]
MLDNTLKTMLVAVRKAGTYISRDFYEGGAKLQLKGVSSFFTKTDLYSENNIIKELFNAGYKYYFLTEENSDLAYTYSMQAQNSNLIWVLDPLDGTANFINNHPLIGISLALAKGKKIEDNKFEIDSIVIGLIYLPIICEAYFSTLEGAFLSDKNGNNIRLHNKIIGKLEKSALAHSMFMFSFPKEDTNCHIDEVRKFDTIIEKIKAFQCCLRISGSIVSDMIYLLTGKAVAIMHYSCKIWDVAAGFGILKQSNYKFISPITGEYLHSPESLCENGFIAGNSSVINLLRRELFERTN